MASYRVQTPLRIGERGETEQMRANRGESMNNDWPSGEPRWYPWVRGSIGKHGLFSLDGMLTPEASLQQMFFCWGKLGLVLPLQKPGGAGAMVQTIRCLEGLPGGTRKICKAQETQPTSYTSKIEWFEVSLDHQSIPPYHHVSYSPKHRATWT